MASGTGPCSAAADGVAPQCQQVNGLMDQGSQDQDKGHRDRIGKKHILQKGGISVCSVNITNR
eukprot:5437489-Karenia_brevis.AAC.1